MKYEVVIAWYPVKAGDIIETDSLHDALKPNVRELPEKAKESTLEIATPRRGRPPKEKDEE